MVGDAASSFSSSPSFRSQAETCWSWSAPPDPPGPPGTRQALNDYTGFLAGDPDLGGEYFGYDGPCPPWNDSLIHHYEFTLFALGIARLDLPRGFNGAQAREAMADHILASASVTGTYTLNQRLL